MQTCTFPAPPEQHWHTTFLGLYRRRQLTSGRRRGSSRVGSARGAVFERRMLAAAVLPSRFSLRTLCRPWAPPRMPAVMHCS